MSEKIKQFEFILLDNFIYNQKKIIQQIICVQSFKYEDNTGGIVKFHPVLNLVR